jgi:cytochrome P450
MQQSFMDTVDQEPYGSFDKIREEGEVVWDERARAWLVLSTAAAREVFKDDRLFVHPYHTMQAGEFYRRLRNNNPRPLQMLQGEEHRSLHRWWLLDLLSARRVNEYRHVIDNTISGLLDEVAGPESFEVLDTFSERVPTAIFCTLLGLPDLTKERLARIKDLNDRIAEFAAVANALKLESNPSAEDLRIAERGVQAGAELDEILLPAIRSRRDAPRDDFISRLWAGGPSVFPDWNQTDMIDACKRLLFAGSDTTTHTLANGLYSLSTNPVLRDTVRTNGQKAIERFVEETLRLNGSVQFRPRRASADTELGGASIKEGDMLFVLLIASNRDAAQFQCPHAIDLERKNPQYHLTFASGPRACPGQFLARAELVSAISGILERFPRIRLDTTKPPPRFQGFLLRSYRPLWVCVD